MLRNGQCASFSVRFKRCVRNLVTGHTHGRELDEAFENGDGDRMVVELLAKAKSEPEFLGVLKRWHGGEWLAKDILPDSWRRAWVASEYVRQGELDFG